MEHELQPRELQANVVVPQLLSRFIDNGHLIQVSCQSDLSANVKGDNEMIPGAVLRSPGIYLTTEEIPG